MFPARNKIVGTAIYQASDIKLRFVPKRPQNSGSILTEMCQV